MGENEADSAWKADKRSAVPPGQCSGTHVHVAMAAIQKCGFQLVEEPPYSPVIAPSDYYLFPKVEKELGGYHFARDGDATNAVDHFLRDQNDVFYTEGICLLHNHWTKCDNVGGDYVEKLLHWIF